MTDPTELDLGFSWGKRVPEAGRLRSCHHSRHETDEGIGVAASFALVHYSCTSSVIIRFVSPESPEMGTASLVLATG